MSKTRIYLVALNDGTGDRLIRATSNSQAMRHVAERLLTAKVATQDELVAAIGRGRIVENAKPDNDTLELPLGDPA